MKIVYFILVFLMFPTLAFSQNKVKGRITDTDDHPIPFASIAYYHCAIGSMSDADGVFSIRKVTGDSIKVSSVGFVSKKVLIDDTTETFQIKLKKDTHLLREVTINARRRTSHKIVLGHYKSDDNFDNLLAVNLQQATFIPNASRVRGYMDEIKFKLKEFRNKSYLLRIRLFDVTENGYPSKDLLFSDNIILPTQLRRVNRFSIKSKNIQIPEDGVFVSFE